MVNDALVRFVQQQPLLLHCQRTRSDAAVQLLLLPCGPQTTATAASPVTRREDTGVVRVWCCDQGDTVQQQWDGRSRASFGSQTGPAEAAQHTAALGCFQHWQFSLKLHLCLSSLRSM